MSCCINEICIEDVTLAVASLLVVAISGVMLLVSYILKPAIANFGGAEEMLLAVKALGLMVILMVTVAVTSIALAGLFVPLMFSVSLAIASISLVVVFIEALSDVMGDLSTSLESMGDVDSEGIQEFTKFMIEFTSSMILLVTPLISFNLVSWTLAGLLFTASIGAGRPCCNRTHHAEGGPRSSTWTDSRAASSFLASLSDFTHFSTWATGSTSARGMNSSTFASA